MSLSDKIKDVFDEPACDKNQAKDEKARKKGCSKPLTPGAAAGGCAFDGAKIVLQPIVDAAHLVHGPLACEGNGWDNRHAASSGSDLYRKGFTTDLTELDIVMGNGEKKLFRAIRALSEQEKPAAVFVYQTCVTALIGDDVEAVCKRASEKFGLPVIPVNAPGFAGSKNLGNKLAGETLLDHVIGTVEPDDAGPTDINILGEYNLAGELWQVKPLFEALGIRIRACITGDARYRDVAAAHTAKVNIMICSAALVNVARKMEERYGQRWFEGSFYGIDDTSHALRTTARLLVETGVDPGLVERAERLIAAEEARVHARLAALKPRVQGKRVLLYTGGVKSWSIVSALQELGMEVVGTSVRKSTDEDKGRIHDLFGSEHGEADPHMFEAIPPREMYAMLARGEADIMLSGGRTQFIALKARVPWLDINQERHHAFAGYEGMVDLIEQLALALENPVFPLARKPAPWSADGVVEAVAAPAPVAFLPTAPVVHHRRKFEGLDAHDIEEC